MEMNFKLVYTIKEVKDWRGESMAIESNLSSDELVDCKIAKSLMDYLIKESSALEPDRLLLGFAEAQKRGLEQDLQAMDDLALEAKNKADNMHAITLRSYDEAEERYQELEEKFTAIRDRFSKKVDSTRLSIERDLSEMEKISSRLKAIDSYDLNNITQALHVLIELVEKDKDLVKLVLEKKKQ